MWPTFPLALRLSRRERLPILVVAAASCVAAAALDIRDAEPAPLTVEQARCDPTFAGATTGSCTLVIRNPSRDADRLLTIETSAADHVEIHSMKVVDGIMRMRRLAQGVDIDARSSVDFSEQGYHLMLVGLKAPLSAGGAVEATLSFELAGVKPVAFRIEERERR